MKSPNSVGESSNAGIQPSSDGVVSSSTLTTAQILKIPSDGWGISLEEAPHFTGVELDKHIARSSKIMGAGMHLSLPTGLAKAKTHLQDDYLHDIQTSYDQQYFFYRAKCFHPLKKTKSSQFRSCFTYCFWRCYVCKLRPFLCSRKSCFCNHMLALMLKICKYTLYNCVSQNVRMKLMKTLLHCAPQPYRHGINQG